MMIGLANFTKLFFESSFDLVDFLLDGILYRPSLWLIQHELLVHLGLNFVGPTAG